MNARRSSIWGLATVCCLPALVSAQHNPNGQIPVNTLADPYLVLIRDTVVQNELRLSDDQRRAVRALTDELDVPLWTLRNQSGDQATQLFQKLNSTAERRMEQILSAAQRKRLAQIRLSVRGLKALLRDEVAEQLKLSDQQRTQIRQILEEPDSTNHAASPAAKNGPTPARPSKPGTPTNSQPARVAAILSREQLAQARDLLGSPLDVSKLGYVKFKAPELDGKDGWLHSEPLTMAQLRGRVVALHFWTFG